jgi:hypothetical protein
MIELKDIRAGNKVLFNRSGSTVTVLKVDNNEVLLDTFPESSHYSYSNISGIALSTSMLEDSIQLNFVGFQNADKGIVLNIINNGDKTNCKINWNRKSFTENLAAHSITTLKWKY